jgi:hypothetical protein
MSRSVIRGLGLGQILCKQDSIIILLILCANTTWSVTPKEDHSLRIFEKKVLRKKSESERERETALKETGENCRARGSIKFRLHHITLW